VTTIERIIPAVFLLLSPIGLLYGWFFYSKHLRHENASWRNRVTAVSLASVSLAFLSWPAMAVLAPRADWATGAGVGHLMRWVEWWYKPIFLMLVGSVVLCLFGRTRLILPIAVACVGAATLWLFSTMP
jgi:hypothetical protein